MTEGQEHQFFFFFSENPTFKQQGWDNVVNHNNCMTSMLPWRPVYETWSYFGEIHL